MSNRLLQARRVTKDGILPQQSIYPRVSNAKDYKTSYIIHHSMIIYIVITVMLSLVLSLGMIDCQSTLISNSECLYWKGQRLST